MTLINLKVEIRRNADGETVSDIWPEWEFNQFWWEDGNASCDCNRRLFFDRAQGKKDPCDWEKVDCGEGGYSVRLSDAESGAVLYDELTQ